MKKWLFLLWSVSASVQAVVAEPVRLASLDWPPYTGHQLEQQGETSILLRQVFAAMQLEVQTEFLPWSRGIRASESSGASYAGYFPEYQTHNPSFILSDSLGSSELGFVESGFVTHSHVFHLFRRELVVIWWSLRWSLGGHDFSTGRC